MLINHSKGLWKTGQSGRRSISKPINTKAIYNEKVGFFFFFLVYAMQLVRTWFSDQG